MGDCLRLNDLKEIMKILKILGYICLAPVCLYLLKLWWTKEIGDLELFLIIFIGGFAIICALSFLHVIIDKFKRK